MRFVPRPTHAPGRFCGGGDLAGGALGVSPAHTVPAAHESGRKSLWSKRDRFIFFLQKGSWKKTAPKTAPKRPGTATRKPRHLEAGTWHVVFSLISRETRCVHPPPLSPPLPIPLRLHPHVCRQNRSHRATFLRLPRGAQPLRDIKASPSHSHTLHPHPRPTRPARRHPISFQNPTGANKRPEQDPPHLGSTSGWHIWAAVPAGRQHPSWRSPFRPGGALTSARFPARRQRRAPAPCPTAPCRGAASPTQPRGAPARTPRQPAGWSRWPCTTSRRRRRTSCPSGKGTR